jgi:hypothetical protein
LVFFDVQEALFEFCYMNIRYFASRTSNGKENLFQYFYWKIAGLEDCKIGQPLNFDFQGMTKRF